MFKNRISSQLVERCFGKRGKVGWLVGWVREKREEGTKWDEMEMEREGRGETS